MRQIITGVILVILSFVLQSTFLNYIAIGRIAANLLIFITAYYGFTHGKKAGITVGFFCGLLTDIFTSNVLGFYALIYMYIGFFNGFFKRLFYKDDLKYQIILIGSSDFVYGFVVYLLRFLLRKRLSFSYYFINIIIPEVIYTIVLTIVLFVVQYAVNKWILKKDMRRSTSEIV